jgi:hypothetical protein
MLIGGKKSPYERVDKLTRNLMVYRVFYTQKHFMFYPSTLAFLIFTGVAFYPPAAWADVDLQGLVTRSPFGEGKAGASGQRTGSLEFRGYYVDNGITYFSIYNPSSKSSVWVAQGETSTTPFAVSVKNFDPEKNAVTLESNGQSMNLSLHESVIVKMELPATPTTPQANNNGEVSKSTTAVVGSGTAGQAPTAEQAQSFKDSMRQRWQDRQNQNGGNDNKNKGNKGADSGTSSETTNTNSNRKNKNN